ncbi:MAG: hypothetical protein U0470_01240 [Anaerolineae bacterium]
MSLGIVAIVLLWTTGAQLGISAVRHPRLASDLHLLPPRRPGRRAPGGCGSRSACSPAGRCPPWPPAAGGDVGDGAARRRQSAGGRRQGALWMFGGGILVGLGADRGRLHGGGLFGLANLGG